MVKAQLHPRYVKDLKSLETQEQGLAEKAHKNFVRDPRHPGLRFKQIEGNTDWHTIRVNAAIRIALRKATEEHWVFCRVAHHDVIDRVIQNRVLWDAGLHCLVWEDPECKDNTLEDLTNSWMRLSHWQDHELDGYLQLSAEQIRIVRELSSPEEIFHLADNYEDFTPSQAEDVRTACEKTPADFAQSSLFGRQWGPSQMQRSIEQFGPPRGLSRLFSPEEMERINFDPESPIEDWMVFLHPDQEELVDQEFSGPARVSGPAGTGKTVVALHRAACLAGRYAPSPQEQPILYTTFVASLTSVLRNLYERLPQTVPGKVHFVHIDGLARQICEEADQPVAVMRHRMNSAFNKAFEDWKNSDEVQNSPAVGYDHELKETLRNARYMRTEIDNVIKGCGITTEADYMPDKLARRGRQVAFDRNVRKLVWRLYESYQRNLLLFQTKDYRDQVAAAVQIIESETKPRYRCVIVDESQDLTFMQMRLVAELSGTQSDSNASPDRLFIVGDVAQRVHPNFWTLQELGVEIRGRSAVLTRNYRSTAEIMECAIAIAGSDDVVDIDEETAAYQQDRAARSARHGEIPILVTCADNEIQIEQAVAAVRSAQSRGVGLGDIAVLVPNNELKDTWSARLRKAELEVMELDHYDGVAGNEIKVGTYDRAKGLSFKAVLLPDVTEGRLPSKRQELETDDAYAERCALWRSRLYVAATRAREDLAFFCIGEVSEFMTYALDYVTKQEP